ncbi:hypothetical protein [Georgenia sp. SYP-B2076]|uniref:hypothetical protein n=1 Tax=Georgenia sp. SYP-B2076 TaxID=2495881 RepID=UPI00197AC7E9|nr:hypothetical protein [Georgenia sp. SYP-B2076]
MTSPDLPLARRLRRPTWRDPRLGIGLLLVAGSVAVGTWAVRDAAATTDVYAARQALVPGDVLDAEALVVEQVRLRAPEGRYLLAADGPPESSVVIRTVGAGELVPRTAVGRSDAVDLRPVVVPLGLSVPADLGPGTVVDLWLTLPPVARTASGEPAQAADPALLAADLVVAEVLEDSSMFVGGTGVSVELLVPRLSLPDVLGALASDGQLVAVPTFGDPPVGSVPGAEGASPADGQDGGA